MTNTPMFGTFGRYTEIPINDMTPEQKKGYDSVVRERGQAPGPYKIWLQNAPLMQIMVPIGAYFQEGHSSLSGAEREIAINLIKQSGLRLTLILNTRSSEKEPGCLRRRCRHSSRDSPHRLSNRVSK